MKLEELASYFSQNKLKSNRTVTNGNTHKRLSNGLKNGRNKQSQIHSV